MRICKETSVIFHKSLFLFKNLSCVVRNNISNVYKNYSSSVDDNIHNTHYQLNEVFPIQSIRNVGVIAHIDAGKTTTTERILYYSDCTKNIGEVDLGTTVTDYLPEERERGITIVTSAASLFWRNHFIHLLDTPGHVDFTYEVERSLSVLDSAVVVLDATKGVQVQTRTVCQQADHYQLPRLVYVNKMDRSTANLKLCLETLKSQLGNNSRYVSIHWPIYANQLYSQKTSSNNSKNDQLKLDKNNFIGFIDLISMNLKSWDGCTNLNDPYYEQNLLELSTSFANSDSKRPVYLDKASFVRSLEARLELLTNLADLDEEFADQFLQLDRPEMLIPPDMIADALKRATYSSKIVPVLVGSSKQNIGIQSLLDAFVDFLPNASHSSLPKPVSQTLGLVKPSSSSHAISQDALANLSKHVIMYVFKILYDPHRGPLTLARIYSGFVQAGLHVVNLSKSGGEIVTDKVLNVFRLTGNNFEVVESAGPGSIVAFNGLKSTYTGDVLSSPKLSLTCTDAKYNHDQHEVEADFYTPKPVVYAAFEPGSRAEIRTFENALDCMMRQDPSLCVKFNSETGQWIVGAMGDLHLQVTMARLRREFKVNARMGPMLIAYKECPSGQVETGFAHLAGLVGGRQKAVAVQLTVAAHTNQDSQLCKPMINFDRSCFNHWDDTKISKLRNSLVHVCGCALEAGGPLLHSPVLGVSVTIKNILIGDMAQIPTNLDDFSHNLHKMCTTFSFSQSGMHSVLALVKSCTIGALQNALNNFSDWTLLEPVMYVHLNIPVDPDYGDVLSPILGDLSSRRAEIKNVNQVVDCEDFSKGFSSHCVEATVPLAELLDYSHTIRTLSSGRAELYLRLEDYKPVNAEQKAHILSKHCFSEIK